MKCPPRKLVYIGSSKKDLQRFPIAVKEMVGQELAHAQDGLKPNKAKPLQGFNGTQVMQIAISRIGAYRVVYTNRFEGEVCVLHCFQKKSSSGVRTSKQDIELVKSRLAQAAKEHGK